MLTHRAPATRAPAALARAAAAALTTALIPLASCFDPAFRDPVCGGEGECPKGWVCAAGPGQGCALAVDAAPGAPDTGPPPGCVPTWIDVLGNGNFEGGHATWREEPAGTVSICHRDELTLATHEGAYSACFGRNDNRLQILSQEVALPPGTTRVRLQGYRCFVTLEEPADGPLDVMTVTLTRPNDDTAVIASLASWSNLDAGADCRWNAFDDLVADVTVAADRAVLRVYSKLDNGRVSSFYLDSLRLQAFACPPAVRTDDGSEPT